MGSASARVLVDLGALAANYRVLSGLCEPGQTGAVVKADAYGLGLEPVVRCLLEQGCKHFFVANLEEGIAVRQLNEAADVFVFAGPQNGEITRFLSAGLTPVLNHRQQQVAWQNATSRAVCLHIDTGMSRLGFRWDRISSHDFGDLSIRLLMTHLACADEPDQPLNSTQLQRFAGVQRAFPGVATSIGNSAAIFLGASSRGSLSRPGIALYGGNPATGATNPMQPVVKFEAKVLALQDLPAGVAVGYGASHRLKAASTLAVLGAGYADGIPRLLSNRGMVAFGDVRLPILGCVSMDLTVVDASAQRQHIEVGDWVEVFGRTITLEEVAGWADTIDYEILTGLGQRPQRLYFS